MILIPRSFEPYGKHSDSLAILSNFLLVRTSQTAERKRFGHWIDVSSRMWRKLFSNKYPSIKREAVKQDLIDTNESYSTDLHFPKSIRLQRRFRTGKTQPYVFKRKRCTSPTVRFIDWSNLGDVGCHLYEQLAKFRVGELAVELNPWDRFSLHQLQHSGPFASRCSFGRFHSPFTNIKKAVRHSLELKTREPLIEIDVQNSQPLLLAALAQKITNSDSNKTSATQTLHSFIHLWNLRTRDGSNRQTTTQHTQPHIPQCCTLSARQDTQFNKSRFSELCERGVIYEFILDRCRAGEARQFEIKKCGKTWTVDPAKFDRKRIKKSFLVAMFDRPEATRTNPVYQILNRHFPEVATVIEQIKNSGGHQALAHQLQRLESSIVIDGVCGELRLKWPQEPILTVHDSVICRESFASTIKGILIQHFQKHGVTPQLSTTHFSNRT